MGSSPGGALASTIAKMPAIFAPAKMPNIYRVWPRLYCQGNLAESGLAVLLGSSPGGARASTIAKIPAIFAPAKMPNIEWPRLDLNQGPTGYEPAALTN